MSVRTKTQELLWSISSKFSYSFSCFHKTLYHILLIAINKNALFPFPSPVSAAALTAFLKISWILLKKPSVIIDASSDGCSSGSSASSLSIIDTDCIAGCSAGCSAASPLSRCSLVIE